MVLFIFKLYHDFLFLILVVFAGVCFISVAVILIDYWYWTHLESSCTSCSAVYCNRSCLFVGVWLCLWVCYHDNS